jgi:hypothetical protein
MPGRSSFYIHHGIKQTRMFPWRKPKHDEDEPLVPHGLVWQATEEPAENSSPEPPQKPSQPAPPIEINPKSDLSCDASTVTTAKKPVANAEVIPPIAWPSPDQLKREIPPFNTSGNITSDKGPRLIHSANIDRPSIHLKREKELLVNVHNQLGAISRSLSSQRRGMSRFIAGMLRECSLIFSRASATLKLRQRMLRERYESAEFKRTLASAAQVALQRVRATCSRARPYGANFKLRAANILASALAYTSLTARRILAAKVRVRLKRNAISSAWGDADIRTKLSQWQPQARILLARARAEWTLNQRRLARDSRLWTSVAMAAFSALLAVAFISVVRHYATESLPSRHMSREIGPVTASAVKPQSAEPPKQIAAKAVQELKPKSVQPARAHAAPARPKTAPKPRRTEDGDYVARDTYVYYGNQPNRSH